MKKRNMFIRIFAIILCLIMVLGVIVVGISTLANGEEIVSVVSAVDTGSNDKPMVIIAAVAVVAVAAVAACVISSGKKKKTVSGENKEEN